MWVSAILAAGGRGTRIGAAVPKQLLMIGNRSILQRSFETLESSEQIDEIVVALPSELAAAPPPFLKSSRIPIHIVDGGDRRQDSVANAFAQLTAGRTDRVVIHDAARPFATAGLFARVIEASKSHDVIAALPVGGTLKEVAIRKSNDPLVVVRTVARDSMHVAQTPQAFSYEHLAAAIELGRGLGEATDEAALIERAGYPVAIEEGEATNIKITTEQDLRMAEALVRSLEAEVWRPPAMRIGVGYDLHRLEPGRKLILGGVELPHATGLIGHSDADVLCHAITDAILGAACQGDIGGHFPDTDPMWKGANSIGLLRGAVKIVREAGFFIANVDAVVIAELPKLTPHIEAIRHSLAHAIGVHPSAVSVKGKTNETVGALGRNEAIAVHAVALLAVAPERSVAL